MTTNNLPGEWTELDAVGEVKAFNLKRDIGTPREYVALTEAWEG